jgi:hypothetical protein
MSKSISEKQRYILEKLKTKEWSFISKSSLWIEEAYAGKWYSVKCGSLDGRTCSSLLTHGFIEYIGDNDYGITKKGIDIIS